MTAVETRPAWRCTGCGRVANSVHKPSSHRRHGQSCGPFTSALIAPEGSILAPAGATITAPAGTGADAALRYRQSTLRSFYECPRSTVLASQLTTGIIGSSADAGSAFHAVAAEVRRTLRSPARRLKPGQPLPSYVIGTGESQMSTQEAVEIMREVIAAGPWILSPTDYAGDGDTVGLVQMVCNLADEKWNPSRFMAIEQRLSMEILCPDGEIRLLTGTPDYVVADPGSTPGIIIGDDKTGLAKPPTPRVAPEDGEPIRGAQYLAEFFQLAVYWILAANEWPFAQQAIGREKNWRWNGPPREIVFTRDDLEHLVPWVADIMMKLDRGLTEGEGSEYAQPRSGAKCTKRCPVARSCPIPAEQRGVGALDSDEAADAEAARWVVIRAVGEQMREALKTRFEETGRPIVVNENLHVRWKPKANGKGRDFGAFAPADPAPVTPAADDAFVASIEQELQRRGVAA